MTERAIFEAAVEISDLAKRIAFLDEACEANAEMRERIDALLKSHDQAGSFLNIPAVGQNVKPDNGFDSRTTMMPAGSPPHEADEDGGKQEGPDLSFLLPSSKPGSIGLLGHYEVLQILGRGAFGLVFKAFDEKLHRMVAIKVLNPALAATSPPRKRFLREARSSAAVRHENIVAIHAVEEQPVPYLVMEYIPGKTLQQWLDEHGPLDPVDVLKFGQQIAAGLSGAHAQGLIHRDIKPANILIDTSIEARIKITDFGLARAVDDASMTQSGLIAGTPMYMAPEQARGQTLDHRADLFSLGTVLYTMASGRPPFRASNTIAVLKRVCEDAPRPISEVIPGSPTWLDEIIAKLHAKEPEGRFQSAREVADLLARYLIHPPSSHPVQNSGHGVTGLRSPVAPRQERRTSLDADRADDPQSTSNVSRAPGLPVAERQGYQQAPKSNRRWLIATTVLTVALVATFLFLRARNSQTANLASRAASAPGQAEPTDSTNPDRRAAEWVLLIGGTIGINENGAERRINAGRDLPDGAFELTYVNLHHIPKVSDVGLALFKDCKNLTILNLSVTKVTDAGLANFKNCKNLTYLELSETQVTDAGLAHFKYCKNLTRLGLQYATRVTGAGLAHFKDCKNLQSLMLIGTKVSDAGMADFKDCKSLTDLYLNGCDQVSDAMLAHFKDCQNLSLLDLGYTQVTDAGLAHFKNCKNLVQLNLTATKVSDAGLVNFKDCKNLQHLHLSVTQVTDVGLVHFKDCANLTALSLNATQVSDAGLAHFKDCRNLTILNLWTTAVSDVSLERLADDPKLIFVDVRKTKVTEAGVKKLSAALPGCKIEWDGGVIEPRTGWHGWPADAPPPAIAPFDAEQAQQHQAAWAKYLGVPVEYTNSLGMKFRLIPPGEFMMGSTREEVEAALKILGEGNQIWLEPIQSEGPQHKVILTQPIYLGVYEATQAEYEKVIEKNPSYFSKTGSEKLYVERVEELDTTAGHPVEGVSWKDAAEFCVKLSEKEKLKPFYFFRDEETVKALDGTGYRLSTEAEWEFACRGGTTTRFWIGDSDESLLKADWFNTNARLRTHQVGELKGNPFGLYDTHGNVSEWVQDRWDPTYYAEFTEKPAINPSGQFPGSRIRVIRGGVWVNPVSYCRASNRLGVDPTVRVNHIGFRVSLPVDAVRQALKVDGAKIVKPGVPVGANGNPVAEQGRSAWDDLDPAQIPEAERVPRQPEGLVAVLGQHRRRFWNTPYTMSVSQDDAQYSVTTEYGGGLHLFSRDPQQPTQVFNLDRQHPAATFLADGKIAVGDDTGGIPNGGGQLRIFAKPRDGMPLEKLTATNAEILAAMHTSSNGEWLAGNERFEDGSFGIGLWRLGDAPPRRAVKFVLPKPSGMSARISFSPDGHWFCFTHEDKAESLAAVHLIDLQSDIPREAFVLKAEADEKSDAPAKGFLHAAFLSDGRLATADRNGRTWFWKINDGEPQQVGSIRDTGSFAAASQSLRLIVGLGGTQFRVWDLAADPPQLLGSSPQFDSLFNTQAIAPNGETVFTGHHNGAVRFWNVSKAGVTELDPLAPNPNFAGRQFKVIDRFLCASTEASRVGVWRPTPDGLQALPLESPSLLVVGASSAQRQLIVREPGVGGGTVLLRCDADRMSPIRRITGDNVASATLNDEGNRLAIGRENGASTVLELWGWESDDLPARKLAEIKPPAESVQQLAFVEAGRALVGRVGLRFQMWDVKDDQLIPRASLPARHFNQFALAPDGQTLATAGGGNPLELWSLKSDLTQPTTSFAIPEANAVAFSPDGRRLAVAVFSKDGGSAEAEVQIINLASGVVEKRLTFPGRVDELTFTDDSRHLITGNANATIYVVRLQGPPSK